MHLFGLIYNIKCLELLCQSYLAIFTATRTVVSSISGFIDFLWHACKLIKRPTGKVSVLLLNLKPGAFRMDIVYCPAEKEAATFS